MVQAAAMVGCAACGAENPEGQRFCGSCAAPLADGGERQQRKTVTVVFCDVVGSTALGESADPEAIAAMLARYFERMKASVERHGGTVEKFIGDAVVAVFGVPVAHEDDGLRALRAAVEMREALQDLQVQARIGVNTGEIVTSGFGTLVTGDAVDVAARLEQAAASGEVLVGASTLALAGDAAGVEELEPLRLKGKAEPVAAFRLLAVSDTRERSNVLQFVGRTGELAVLDEAWARVLERGDCEFVTILGEPGVGKSRLVTEFLAGDNGRVVRGRCLSYGEGITYFPVVEVIRQLDREPSDPAVRAALASLLGESDAPTSSGEIAWAFRKVLEEAAPLIVLFDDVQWGEETFLDLIEHVRQFSSGVPLLLLCLGRSELVERRPQWPVTLRLGPLSGIEAEALLPNTMAAPLRERIVHASGGNPLFVTEMVAMSAGGGNEVVVPATLKALLAARLDRLEGADRGVLERGAVEGEVFHRGPVQALTGSQVGPQLSSLIRKELIRPDSGLLPSEDAFRFCHLLVRDAAYEALPKAVRADLHARFADWLDDHGGALVERDEIVGYHLEQACRFRKELSPDDPSVPAIATRAAKTLSAAADRAMSRLDPRAAVNLFGRARALLPGIDARLDIEFALALRLLNPHLPEVEQVLEETVTRAVDAGDHSAELHARLALLESVPILRVRDEHDEPANQQPLLDEALRHFERTGDKTGLMRAWSATAMVERVAGQMGASIEAAEQALALAQATHETRAQTSLTLILSAARLWGPTPVEDALNWLEALPALYRNNFSFIANRGAFVAMQGQFERARALQEEATALWDERVGGSHDEYANVRYDIEMLAGNPAAAEQVMRRLCDQLESEDNQGVLSTTVALLARALSQLGRHHEAETCLLRSEELGEAEDVFTQILWRQTRATVYAHQGRPTDAVQLAREAVEAAARTDLLNIHGDALVDLAGVLEIVDAGEAARDALQQARALFERKGNLAMVRRVEQQLATR